MRIAKYAKELPPAGGGTGLAIDVFTGNPPPLAFRAGLRPGERETDMLIFVQRIVLFYQLAREPLRARRIFTMVELVFIHIPKTAGRTLKDHIATQYPKTAIVNVNRFDLARKRRSLRDLVNRDTRVIMGHLLYRDVEEFLDPQTKVITFLREPVERALSHYYYMAAVEIPRQRKRRPFWLVRQRLTVVRRVSGSQFRALVSLALNPLQLLKPPSLTDWVRLPANLNVATRFLLGRPLDKLWFVGFQERFVEDLRRLARALNWKPVDESLAVNVNADRKRRSEVPQEICQQIWALNEEDIRMYNQAARLWNFRP